MKKKKRKIKEEEAKREEEEEEDKEEKEEEKKPLEFHTGFDEKQHTITWGATTTLRDAFASVHQFKDSTKHCTSKSPARTEWIDYIWYSEESLSLSKLSDTTTPEQPMPNKTEPSDHRPIGCVFQFKPAAAAAAGRDHGNQHLPRSATPSDTATARRLEIKPATPMIRASSTPDML
uniref:Uncharacterized protein n=1 Tax=Lotharella oceanica TaxID=641309 RepID=A0A7S2TSS5_9EUKA